MGLSRECGLCAMRGRLAVGPRELWPTSSSLNHSFSSPFVRSLKGDGGWEKRVECGSKSTHFHSFSGHPAVSLLHFHHYNSTPFPSFYSPIPLLILSCQPAPTHFPAAPIFFLSLSHAAFRPLPPRLSAPESMSTTDGLLGPAVYFEAHFGPGSIPPGSSRPSPPPSPQSHFPANHFPSLTSSPLPIFLLSIPISSSLNHSSLSSPFFAASRAPKFPHGGLLFLPPAFQFPIFSRPILPLSKCRWPIFPILQKMMPKPIWPSTFHIQREFLCIWPNTERTFKSPTKMQLLRV